MNKLGVVKLERGMYAFTQLEGIIQAIEESIDGTLHLEGIESGKIVDLSEEQLAILKEHSSDDNQVLLSELYSETGYTTFRVTEENQFGLQLDFIIGTQIYKVENVVKRDDGVVEFYSTFEDLEFLADKLEEWLSK